MRRVDATPGARPPGDAGARRVEAPLAPAVVWAATAWVAVWLGAFGAAFPLTNFINLCDVAMLLTWVGLVTRNRLVLSSQALSSTVIGVLWVVDVAGMLATGRHPIGGTEYMFNPHEAIGLRLLSAFHVALPFVQIWAVRQVGYDRRALPLQAAIAAAAMAVGRLVGPAANINFSFRDPVFRASFGAAPVHLAVILAALVGVAYVPTHLVLARLYGPRRQRRGFAELSGLTAGAPLGPGCATRPAPGGCATASTSGCCGCSASAL